MRKVILCALLAVPAAFAAEDGLSSLPQHAQPTPGLHASGQPSAESLAALPASGVEVVIDLRPTEEHGTLDEAGIVARSGIRYEHLPVSGKAGLNRETVQAFDDLLRKHAGKTVLAHCASGNRVGALMALRAAWIEGKTAAEALALGDKSGLGALRGAVEALLKPESSPAASPARP
jgi:uncharacterized protein (TIGR01244 family)